MRWPSKNAVAQSGCVIFESASIALQECDGSKMCVWPSQVCVVPFEDCDGLRVYVWAVYRSSKVVVRALVRDLGRCSDIT